MTTRVQIPVNTDRWAMGDRYGEVVKTYPKTNNNGSVTEMAMVKLDNSGKVVRVVLADCDVVE